MSRLARVADHRVSDAILPWTGVAAVCLERPGELIGDEGGVGGVFFLTSAGDDFVPVRFEAVQCPSCFLGEVVARSSARKVCSEAFSFPFARQDVSEGLGASSLVLHGVFATWLPGWSASPRSGTSRSIFLLSPLPLPCLCVE